MPRAPTKQGDRVAVRVKKTDDDAEGDIEAAAVGENSDDEDGMEMIVETGPKGGDQNDSKEEDVNAVAKDSSAIKVETSNGDASAQGTMDKVIGGAWG